MMHGVTNIKRLLYDARCNKYKDYLFVFVMTLDLFVFGETAFSGSGPPLLRGF